MNLFLSSSNDYSANARKLENLITGKKIAYSCNALDGYNNIDFVAKRAPEDIELLTLAGATVCNLDLKDYFDHRDKLALILSELDGVFFSGGNVYRLRTAMKISGFDSELRRINESGRPFFYGGYSAGCCVLSTSLEPYTQASNPNHNTYPEMQEIIWQGLGLIDFAFLLHFESEHCESEAISKELEFCIENKVPYKTLKDGDALILKV